MKHKYPIDKQYWPFDVFTPSHNRFFLFMARLFLRESGLGRRRALDKRKDLWRVDLIGVWVGSYLGMDCSTQTQRNDRFDVCGVGEHIHRLNRLNLVGVFDIGNVPSEGTGVTGNINDAGRLEFQQSF